MSLEFTENNEKLHFTPIRSYDTDAESTRTYTVIDFGEKGKIPSPIFTDTHNEEGCEEVWNHIVRCHRVGTFDTLDEAKQCIAKREGYFGILKEITTPWQDEFAVVRGKTPAPTYEHTVELKRFDDQGNAHNLNVSVSGDPANIDTQHTVTKPVAEALAKFAKEQANNAESKEDRFSFSDMARMFLNARDSMDNDEFAQRQREPGKGAAA